MFKFNPTAEQTAMLVKAGSLDYTVHAANAREVAKAIELPLRQAVLPGDILPGVFNKIVLPFGASPEFPLGLIAPGTEKRYVGYTIPKQGYLPHKLMEGDYVMLTTYPTGCSIDIGLRILRDARWDVMKEVMAALYNQVVKKDNDDGMHTILAAAKDRNIVVYDGDAAAGQFTKRLVSLGKTVMRRNGGGNSSSINRRKLTDMWLSPEGMEDIRNWGVDQVDETTRREIYVADEGSGAVSRIFGVNLHDTDEFGVDQEYQLYYENTLSGSLQASDVELAIGLDLSRNSSFVNPVREELQIFEDSNRHRHQQFSLYGWKEQGWAALDSRNVISLSY